MSDQAAKLTELRAKEQQLIESISVIELTVFANQQAIDRKLALASDTPPGDDATALSQEIVALDAAIERNNTRLLELQTQLSTVQTEISVVEQSLFPSEIEPPPPPPPPPSSALLALKNNVITTAVSAAKVLKTGLPSVSVPGLDPAAVSGLLSSTTAAVNKAKDAVTGAVKMPAALQAATSLAASALGGAKAAASIATGSAAVGALSNLAKKKTTEITAAAGIGNFGLSPDLLEKQGLIKPGAIQAFLTSKPAQAPTAADTAEAARINQEGGKTTAIDIAANRALTTVLSSPAVWAGKDQVNGLAGLVKNEKLQGKIQQFSLKDNLTAIKNIGVVTGGETAAQLGALAQTAAKFGPSVTALWSKGQALPGVTDQINALAKNAEQAVTLVTTQLSDLGSLPFNPGGAVGTVNRQAVNNALAQVLGDPKIPVPQYGGPRKTE